MAPSSLVGSSSTVDSLDVLQVGGTIVLSGSDGSDEIQDHFATVGHRCIQISEPATFALELDLHAPGQYLTTDLYRFSDRYAHHAPFVVTLPRPDLSGRILTRPAMPMQELGYLFDLNRTTQTGEGIGDGSECVVGAAPYNNRTLTPVGIFDPPGMHIDSRLRLRRFHIDRCLGHRLLGLGLSIRKFLVPGDQLPAIIAFTPVLPELILAVSHYRVLFVLPGRPQNSQIVVTKTVAGTPLLTSESANATPKVLSKTVFRRFLCPGKCHNEAILPSQLMNRRQPSNSFTASTDAVSHAKSEA